MNLGLIPLPGVSSVLMPWISSLSPTPIGPAGLCRWAGRADITAETLLKGKAPIRAGQAAALLPWLADSSTDRVCLRAGIRLPSSKNPDLLAGLTLAQDHHGVVAGGLGVGRLHREGAGPALDQSNLRFRRRRLGEVLSLTARAGTRGRGRRDHDVGGRHQRTGDVAAAGVASVLVS